MNLERALAALAAAEARAAAAEEELALERMSPAERDRLRNDAIRRAMAMLGRMGVTNAARQIERDLQTVHDVKDVESEYRRALRDILRFNCGRGLSYRRILDLR
jgi:hypothetical protein